MYLFCNYEGDLLTKLMYLQLFVGFGINLILSCYGKVHM